MSVATTAPVEPSRPAPERPRIRLLPVPQYEPPYDDELPVDSVPLVEGSLPLPFDRPSAGRLQLVTADHEQARRDPFAPERTPRAQLPDPRAWGGRLAQALAEVIDGTRPIGQLLRFVSEDVFEEIEARCHRSAAHARRGATTGRLERRPRTAVRSVHVCEPDDGIAELSATVRRGGRVTALALRIEGFDGRWLCTALQQ